MAVGGGTGGGGGELAYGTAKTSVWWDIENCHVPRGSDSHVIAQNISSALAEVGYKGAVTISAYGDTNKIPSAIQQALSSTGIALNHVPAGVKDASDKKILVDMLFWAVDNPPPANYLLISGDRDFSNALHQLRMRRYNILLAHAPNVSQALVAAARSVWLWTSLLSGGPPLKDPTESCYPGNPFGGIYSLSEVGKKSIGDAIALDDMRNEAYAFTGQPGKQAWRNQVMPTCDIARTFSLPESKEDLGMKFLKQMSLPMSSGSDSHESTQMKYTSASSLYPSTQIPQNGSDLHHQSDDKQFNKAAHEFFGPNNPGASVGSSGQLAQSGGPMNNSANISNNQQMQYAHIRTSNAPPPPPSSYSNSNNCSSYPPPYQQRPPPFQLGSPADFNMLKISDYPSNAHQNGSFPPQSSGLPSYAQNRLPSHCERPRGPQLNVTNGKASSNGSRGTSGSQMPSSVVQGLIGYVQGALNELKANKMTPTEANISDCIHYGMRIQNVNVKMALNCALERNVVVMQKLGANLPFYIGKNDKIWKCVNPLDSNVRHPEVTLDAVQNFLSSARGQAAISSSECRYHAATILKKECLAHLVLGDILQMLNLMVQVKKWIVPSSHGWQPLSYTLKVASGSNACVGVRNKVESREGGKIGK